jgi:hypothetical protein
VQKIREECLKGSLASPGFKPQYQHPPKKKKICIFSLREVKVDAGGSFSICLGKMSIGKEVWGSYTWTDRSDCKLPSGDSCLADFICKCLFAAFSSPHPFLTQHEGG